MNRSNFQHPTSNFQPPLVATKRILVVLPNWFGETLFTTPFFNALRQRRPDAFIAALGWPQCHDILRYNPHIDELLEYDERGAHRGLGGAWRLITLLRRSQFETALILRRSLSRTCWLWLAGIPQRIGFANRKSGWLLSHSVPRPSTRQHKAFSYLPLLDGLESRATSDDLAAVPSNGAADAMNRCEYVVTEPERNAARQWLRAQGVDLDRLLVILHPGANWPHKRWAPASFADIGDQLMQTHAAQVVITGGPDDVALAASIQRQMRHPAIVVAGRTTLRQLGACLPDARLVISNDTGVLHLAAALGRPLVALYGPTSPTLTGPLGDPHHMAVLHHPDCCPRVPCFEPEHPPHPGMASITVEEVYNAAIALLEVGSRKLEVGTTP